LTADGPASTRRRALSARVDASRTPSHTLFSDGGFDGIEAGKMSAGATGVFSREDGKGNGRAMF